jgi:hypothetical protein
MSSDNKLREGFDLAKISVKGSRELENDDAE